MKASESLPERIVGTETEFNPVFVVTNGGEKSWDGKLAIPEGVEQVGNFLSNGGCFYVWSQIPEYATPECRGFETAVYAEEVGEVFMVNAINRHVHKHPSIKHASLHKRTATDAFYEQSIGVDVSKPDFMKQLEIKSWGYHENYLVERQHFKTPLTQNLIMAHLATRGILVGSGFWRPDENNLARILPAQKLLHIETEVSTATTKDKPLLNLRDEAHADTASWARLHITSGDVNVAPWSTWMKLGSTSLVLRLAETGRGSFILGNLPNDMLQAAITYAWDGTEGKAELVNGNKVAAIDIQETLVEACWQMSQDFQLPDEEIQVLEAWRQAVNDYKSDPALLENRTEWIGRRAWLERVQDKITKTNSLLKTLNAADRMWDKMLPVDASKNKVPGIAFLKRASMGFPGYDPDGAKGLITQPPEGTRAAERAYLIGEAVLNGKGATVDWGHVGEYDLSNPYGNNLTHTIASQLAAS